MIEGDELEFKIHTNYVDTPVGELITRVELFKLTERKVYFREVYYDTVSDGNIRNVYIQSDGQIGGISSLRSTKDNIDYNEDFSWINELKPCSFNYKNNTAMEYGLIAEDVEEVNKDICLYDREDKLMSVNYRLLTIPILSELQKANKKIKELEDRIKLLEE